MKKFSTLLVSLILISYTSFASPKEDVLELERESLKKAYKYEKEAKSYDKPVLQYKKEAQILSEEAQYLARDQKEEAYKLKRKSFEQLADYIKRDELFAVGEIMIPSNQRRLVFISLSQNKNNLEQIIKLAKINGFVPVMRGFKDDSYVETTKFLSEIIERTGHGVVIDPETFKEFDVQVVPTYVVAGEKVECAENQSCLPTKFNKISGNVSFEYVFRLFDKAGDKL